MLETKGRDIIFQLRKKWIYKALLSQFLLALALTVLVTILLYKTIALPLYSAIPCLIILFIITAIINRSWKLNEWDVARLLNITKPSLEESTQLVLKPHASLNLLEKLQTKKVEAELLSLNAPHPFKKQLTSSIIVLLIASIISVALIIIPFNQNLSNGNNTVNQNTSINSVPEILLPEIKNATIIVNPPSYTGKGARLQSRFNILAEEGAIVSWQIQTNIPAKEVKLIFNDGLVLQLANDKHTTWRTQRQIKTSGFYQVKVDNKLSELYKIEAVKDQPPTIAIHSPKPTTTINYEENERVIINAALADDYGIKAANISATISSGQGEAVKFKEQKLIFENFASGHKEYHLQKLVDCKVIGMQPGDELYFFVSTVDNHNQETRSEVYIVTLQDTTDMMSMDGMVTSLDIKPELFRSERQIIIETEKLLKDKATINAEQFKIKSNDLGTDQKLLRLRYGKFLGEETDNEIGGDHDHEEPNDNGNKDKTDEILEQYSHKHDNAEDASFFDPATKKQLKETLDQMWNAELKLRTFLPKEALPFEYKALRLLKDLQQKSRAYVPKTGFKATPLKLDKRLTGDLTKINQPVTQETFQKQDAATIITRRALGTLELLKADGNLNALSKETLQQAFQQLSVRAANQPGVYLTALSALRKILNENFRVKDIDTAEQGLQKMTAVAEHLPSAPRNAAMNLSKQYFMNLNKGSRQ